MSENTADGSRSQTVDRDNLYTTIKVEPQGGTRQGDNLERMVDPERKLTLSTGTGQKGVEASVAKDTKRNALEVFLLDFTDGEDKAKGDWLIPGEVEAWTADEADHYNREKEALNAKERAAGKKVSGWIRREGGKRYRNQKKVAFLHFLMHDVDKAPRMTLQELIDKVRASGFEAVIYSSPSHGQPAKGHRYRVVFFLREPWRREWGMGLLETGYRALAKRAGLDGLVDEGCFTPDRLFHLPSSPVSTADLRVSAFVAGREVSWLDLIDLPTEIDVWGLITNEVPGLLASETLAGKTHEIHCPNSEHHSDGRTIGAFVSRRDRPLGLIHCDHEHCRALRTPDFVKLLVAHGELTMEQVERYAQKRGRIRVRNPRTSIMVAEFVAELTALRRFFQMSNSIVLYFPDGTDKPITVTADCLHGLVDQYVDTFVVTGEEGDFEENPARPSKEDRAEIMAGLRIGLPEIVGYLRAPVPGYETRGYYEADRIYSLVDEGLNLARFTPEEGLAWIRANLLDDYEFAKFEDEDKQEQERGNENEAAAIAMMLSVVCRPLLPTAPAFMISGPASGIGKTMLAKFVINALMKDKANVTIYKNQNMERLIASTIASGIPYLLLDNIPRDSLFNDEIANAALTSSGIQVPALYSKTISTLPQRFQWIFTGIKVGRMEDMVRRIKTIEIMHPEEDMNAHSWKHDNPEQFAVDNSNTILEAIYAVLSAPRAVIETPSNFPEWDHYVRAPLLSLRLPDFDKIKRDSHKASEEYEAKSTWLKWLEGTIKETEMNATELKGHVKGSDVIQVVISELLDYRPIKGHENVKSWRELESSSVNVFGKFLNQFVDEKIAGMQLVQRRKTRRYKVQLVGDAHDPDGASVPSATAQLPRKFPGAKGKA